MALPLVSQNNNMSPLTLQNNERPINLFTTLFISALDQNDQIDKPILSEIKGTLITLNNNEFNVVQKQEFLLKIQMATSKVPGFESFCLDEIYEICRFAISSKNASLLELSVELFPEILAYQKPHDESSLNESQYPVFHLACQDGTPEMVSMLIKRGANVNRTVHTTKYYSDCKHELTRMEAEESPYDIVHNRNIRALLKAENANTQSCEYSYTPVNRIDVYY